MLDSERDAKRGRHDCSYAPAVPSIASRRRSAWPLWRAYSSIMWVRIQRRETLGSPVKAASVGERVPVVSRGPAR